jgi:hypothetical protein
MGRTEILKLTVHRTGTLWREAIIGVNFKTAEALNVVQLALSAANG